VRPLVLSGPIALLVAVSGAPAAAAAESPGLRFAASVARAGPRPAASAAERRVQLRVRRVFGRAGLRPAADRFTVPGKGRSRNVIGIRDTPADCLVVVMAHADSMPGTPGAEDNASGVGALVELAPRLADVDPPCDVWLVATGAEERGYTGRPDHLGATALRRRIAREHRTGDLRLALSLDEVGRGSRMWLRSSARRERPGVERAVIRAAAGSGLDVRWLRDSGSGNSDHRELQLAGLPAAKLGVPSNPCRHASCDTPGRLQPATFRGVRRLLERLLGDRHVHGRI
jgi:aminopeptidase YwaD